MCHRGINCAGCCVYHMLMHAVLCMVCLLQGPARPFPSRRVEPGSGHVLTGRVEREDLEDFAFDEQYNTFMSFKFAADPSRANTFVGNHANYMAAGQATVYTGAGVKQSPSAVGGGFGPPPRRKRKRGDRRRELQKMDLGSDECVVWHVVVWMGVPCLYLVLTAGSGFLGCAQHLGTRPGG